MTISVASRRFPARGSSSATPAREGLALDARRGERRAGHGARRPAYHRLRAGAVRLLEVQRAGAKAMSAEEFLRGTPVKAGTKLG